MPSAIPESVRFRIVELVNQGFSNGDIAAELRLNVSTVARWTRRYSLTGNVNTLYNQCGPKEQVSERDKLDIILKSIEDPFATASKIARELDLTYSIWSIKEILRQEGLWTRHAATKPKLKDIHRQKRIDFCVYYTAGHIYWRC